MGHIGINDPRIISDATPDSFWQPGTRLAQNDSNSDYVDLANEERLGGHPIEEHVGKSVSYLKAKVREEASRIVDRGDDFRGLSVGSFHSLSSANRLVNSTIAKNRDIIDQLLRGERQTAFFDAEFGSATGYEAYLPRYHAEPHMRETNSVGVFVLKDPFAKKGWRVQSAYPKR